MRDDDDENRWQGQEHPECGDEREEAGEGYRIAVPVLLSVMINGPISPSFLSSTQEKITSSD
jgi:hypothetical protein